MSEHAGHTPWRFDTDADGELCSLESEQLSLLPYNASPTHCDCDLRMACSYGDADDLLRMLNTHGQLLAACENLLAVMTTGPGAMDFVEWKAWRRSVQDDAAAAIAAAKANH